MKRTSVTSSILIALAMPVSADVVDTFKSVCMPNLGNPEGVETSAKSIGFKASSLGDMFGGYIGKRERTDETVQVNIATKHSFECAVTTSDVADPEQLRSQFFQSLGVSTKKSEITAKIGDQRYGFKFDTQGGEALVVYRK